MAPTGLQGDPLNAVDKGDPTPHVGTDDDVVS
jgi:hypothetical protein